uniref:Homeobox domain-containing protein n=1 Tax=Myripristis murdjan TaxID=586833 RepID=A0A668AWE9_9TELE
MEGTRVSDFSIDRILGPELGHSCHKAPGPLLDVVGCLPDGYFQRIPRLSPEAAHLRPAAPFPVPGYLPYQRVDFGNGLLPCGAGFPQADFTFSAHCGVYRRFGQDAGKRRKKAQQRQRARMRTVFTDSQVKQLEALFELTDYPAVEARAEVARSTGLSEETVRVWFKNRRARRKRQGSGSKVKSPSPLSKKESSSGSNLLTCIL